MSLPRVETRKFAGVLALFLVSLFVYTWIRGEPLHVLHYTDERLHYGLIHEYASGKLILDGPTYSSATTPLFHLTLAPFDALGAPRFVLRALNLALVPIFAALLFSDLRRVSNRLTAGIAALVVVLSPYMAARGFVLLTENYSYLWFLLAARPWLFPRGHVGPRDALVSAIFLTLAALTRQSWLWAAPFFALLAAEPKWRPWLPSSPAADAPAALVGSTAGRVLPFLLPVAVCVPIFLYWGGLVPKNWHGVNQASGVNLKAITFAFVLLGLYGLVVAPSDLRKLLEWRRVLVALIAAFGLGVASGLRHESLFTDSGFIWFVSDRFPNVLGANVLLVGLLAVGLLVVGRAVTEGRWVLVGYVLAFALSFASVKMCYQKYYEVPLLLILVWQGVRSEATRLDQLARLAWVLAGVAYLLARVGRVDPPLLGG
jgi:hypothetical protein